jgi:hypothetical protein
VTRAQALTIGVLAGFVLVVFMAMIALLFINPIPLIFPPTPTPIPPAPAAATLTPTLPNFMPTAGPTSTPAEPTPTNTRVPTVTPRLTSTLAPTVVFNLPTPRPTATPIVPTPTPAPPTETPMPATPTVPPRRFEVSFSADRTELTKGECTDLKWEVVGAISVELDNRSVEPEGEKEVCPEKDTEYKLTVQFPDQARLERETVKITVTQADTGEDNDNNNE